MSFITIPGRLLVTATAILAGLVVQLSYAGEKQRAPITITLMGGPSAGSYVREPAAPAVPALEAATFIVTYTGFTPAAKAAFQRAVNIWSKLITSPVPITVSARFTPMSGGALGAARPNFVWWEFPGFVPGTAYPDALANKIHGSQLDPSPDILTVFRSNLASWHFGSGPAPANKYDFLIIPFTHPAVMTR